MSWCHLELYSTFLLVVFSPSLTPKPNFFVLFFASIFVSTSHLVSLLPFLLFFLSLVFLYLSPDHHRGNEEWHRRGGLAGHWVLVQRLWWGDGPCHWSLRGVWGFTSKTLSMFGEQASFSAVGEHVWTPQPLSEVLTTPFFLPIKLITVWFKTPHWLCFWSVPFCPRPMAGLGAGAPPGAYQ